jgi:hypothetical protein
MTTFAARVPRTLVRPHKDGVFKGADLIYYPAQGVRSCSTGSNYHGLNVAIAWVEWDSLRPLTAVGGFYWQVLKAKAMGCNVVRAMQDGGGGSWLGLYAPGQDYYANRAVAIARHVALANYCASQGMYYYPVLNGCSYNGYLTAPNGGGGFGAIANHAAAYAAALKDLPNVIGFDVAQESMLQYGFAMELQNSAGDPLNIAKPGSAITQAQSFTLVKQILAACRAAAPDLPLTASFAGSAQSAGVWSHAEVAELAPHVDYLDCHLYYDAQPDDLLDLWEQAGATGKPLLVGEVGQNYDAGTAAQQLRHESTVSNVVRAVVPGQPGCYLPPADLCVQVKLRTNGTDVNNYAAFGVLVRATADGANGYLFACSPLAATGQIYTYKKTGGSFAVLENDSLPAPFKPGDSVWCKVQAVGPYLAAKFWNVADEEPSYWQALASDATYTSGRVGFRAAVTGTPARDLLTVDDLLIGDVNMRWPAEQAAVLDLTPPAAVASGQAATGGLVATRPGHAFSGTDTFTLTADVGTITVDTTNCSAAGNGTGTVTVTPDADETSVAFSLTRATPGATTLTLTNGQGWDDPAPAVLVFALTVPSSSAVAAAVLGSTIDGSVTVAQAVKRLYAVDLGPAAGPAPSVTQTITTKDQAGNPLQTITIAAGTGLRTVENL